MTQGLDDLCLVCVCVLCFDAVCVLCFDVGANNFKFGLAESYNDMNLH